MSGHYGRWHPIDTAGSESPVRLYWAEFQTDSEDWERLLHSPLDTLVERLEAGKDWTVNTTIFNHHRRLRPRITFTTALLSEEEGALYLTVYKHNPPEQAS